MGEVINLDGDIAVHNASSLHQTAAELPPGAEVAQVHGNRDEPAAASFTERLEFRTGPLGESIDNLRAFVVQNAEALTHAVEALLESDRMSADAAGQATALIDDLTTPTPSGTGTPGSNAQTQTRNAFTAR